MGILNDILKVRFRLLSKDDAELLFGSHIVVKLFDRDLLIDDSLGVATPNEEGDVQFEIDTSLFSSIDSPGEKLPDLYTVVYAHDGEIYRSPVFRDRNVPSVHGNFSPSEGLVIDLGTFVIGE